MLNQVVVIVLLAALLSWALFLVWGALRRSSKDVLFDLLQDHNSASAGSDKLSLHPAPSSANIRAVFFDRLGQLGLYSHLQRKRYALSEKLTALLTAAAIVSVRASLPGATPARLVMCVLLGLALGYWFTKLRFRSARERHLRALEFYLPIVMERLVMAVQAGLDVIAAIRSIVELESNSADKTSTTSSQLDAVTRLLDLSVQLTEAGLSFEDSLEEIAKLVDSTPLRHAFIHLAVAHKDGGELVMPLTELSDSTQLYYQESVEEQIAKMPVKATLPLVCTFAGLIISFITAPLIQVLTILGNALPK